MHVGFLRHVTKIKAKMLREGLWRRGGSGKSNSGSEDTTDASLLGQETDGSGGVGGPMAHFRPVCDGDGL